MKYFLRISYLSNLFVNNFVMLVQLTNGRTVYMTVDEYLNLTHEEEQYLISINYGEMVSDPFFSRFSKRIKECDDYDLDITDDDIGLDTTEDSAIDDFFDLPDENFDF